MIVLYLIIFVLIGAFVYFMGDLEDTIPNYKKRFNQDYLAVLNTKDEGEIKEILRRMGDDVPYAKWIDENEQSLKLIYNREIMDRCIRENCTDT